MSITLTGNELNVLTYVVSFITLRGYSPSVREISDEAIQGKRLSTSVACYYLNQLQKKGMIDKPPKKVSRGLTLTSDGLKKVFKNKTKCPCCGQMVEEEKINLFVKCSVQAPIAIPIAA